MMARTRFEYRRDSRLLIVEGALEDRDEEKDPVEGCFYFEWTGTHFRLVE